MSREVFGSGKILIRGRIELMLWAKGHLGHLASPSLGHYAALSLGIEHSAWGMEYEARRAIGGILRF